MIIAQPDVSQHGADNAERNRHQYNERLNVTTECNREQRIDHGQRQTKRIPTATDVARRSLGVVAFKAPRDSGKVIPSAVRQRFTLAKRLDHLSCRATLWLDVHRHADRTAAVATIDRCKRFVLLAVRATSSSGTSTFRIGRANRRGLPDCECLPAGLREVSRGLPISFVPRSKSQRQRTEKRPTQLLAEFLRPSAPDARPSGRSSEIILRLALVCNCRSHRLTYA